MNQSGDTPMMISCDHASNTIPRSLDGLGIDPALKALHIAYDIGARQVATLLSKQFNAPLLLANYSRLVVDLNRHHGDPSMFPEVSDRHPIPGNFNLSEQQIQQRLDDLFAPYHSFHSAMVDKLCARFQKPVILSIHSFTDVFFEFKRPWHFGVLWDHSRELAGRLIGSFRALSDSENAGLVIGDNEPYHARDPLGYSLVEHGANRDVEIVLIEIRQDLIADAAGQEWAARIIFEAFNPLLDWTAKKK